jgi:hypothetical protein
MKGFNERNAFLDTTNPQRQRATLKVLTTHTERQIYLQVLRFG